MINDDVTQQLTDTNEANRINPSYELPTNRQKSLQRFLFVVLFLSVVVPAILTGSLLIYENFHRTINQSSRVTANSYADLLQAGMTMPLWNIAPSLGQPLLDTVQIEPAVLKIMVQEANGASFLEYTKPNYSEQEEGIRLYREVVFEDEVLGSVVLIYSLKTARMRAFNESKLLLTIIVIQLVCSLVLMSYFLRRRVFSPLTKLETAAVGIARGDLKTTIPKLINDEFGGLSQQLETMRSSLEHSFATMEERVRERTIELEDLNGELKGTLDKLQQAQGNLVQQEKLAALGSLVAGIAHELNTPIGNGLTVASSMSESTRNIHSKMESGLTRGSLEEFLNEMQEGSHLVVASLDRASELVASFKQVAMDRTSAQRRRFNLAAMLSETRLTLSPMFKHTPYTVSIHIQEDIQLNSYPGPLGQVITNLFNNALIHAFEGFDTGEIIVTAEKADNDNVILKVNDNGKGISEEHLSRIFDPFFTTKLGEGGNGLGMHIVHNIISGVLGGSISIESTLGLGTTFVMNIPLNAPEISDNKTIEGGSDTNER